MRTLSNLPPGVRESDIPGNEPDEIEQIWHMLDKFSSRVEALALAYKSNSEAIARTNERLDRIAKRVSDYVSD